MASLSRRRERRTEEMYKAGVLHGSIDEPVTKHWAPALCLRLRGFVLSHLPLLGYTPVLNPQDCRDDRVPRAAVPRYSSMDNHVIIIRDNQARLVPERRGRRLDEFEQPLAPGRNMRAVEDETWRPVLLGNAVVSLIEQCV